MLINERYKYKASLFTTCCKMKIKNIHYREFLDSGMIKTLEEADIVKALDSIGPRYRQEARAMVILMYLTGARPIEILSLRAELFRKEGAYIIIKMPASKRGLTRDIYLRTNNPLVKEAWEYVSHSFPNLPLFRHYINTYVRKVKRKDGTEKELISKTDKLRYHFKQWFGEVLEDGIPPYYLRHNRFSKLAEAGADMQELRLLKGSKTMDSITPYLHLSKKTAQKIAKRIT